MGHLGDLREVIKGFDKSGSELFKIEHAAVHVGHVHRGINNMEELCQERGKRSPIIVDVVFRKSGEKIEVHRLEILHNRKIVFVVPLRYSVSSTFCELAERRADGSTRETNNVNEYHAQQFQVVR